MKSLGECFVYLTQTMNRRVVLGAKAAGVSAKTRREGFNLARQRLEERNAGGRNNKACVSFFILYS